MSQPIRGLFSHFSFLICLKNTNLVEDVEFLNPVKFLLILFKGFRREVKNVSANLRPGRPFKFSNWPQNPKLGSGHWVLAFCQDSSNSVLQFLRRSRKYLIQSEAWAAILVFWLPKNTNLEEGLWDLASCKVSLNSVLQLHRRSQKCLGQTEARGLSWVPNQPEKHKLGGGHWVLFSYQVLSYSVQLLQRRSHICLSQSEARLAILVFHSSQKTQTW